jgi:glutamyl-Q tRNA(Asp) synthetase
VTRVVTRFAPSPTGYLHLGHAHAALFAWRAAAVAGGHCLLRIEDIDTARCRPEFTEAILEDLAWLGLTWMAPPRVQSAHLLDYRAALDRLEVRGLLYPCFCTRAEIAREIAAAGAAPHGPPSDRDSPVAGAPAMGADGPLYPGTCRQLAMAEREARIAAGLPHALRLDLAAARRAVPGPLVCTGADGRPFSALPEPFGDVVLARKDSPASYHLCATHDDAVQGVTLVTRAEDLRPAAGLHRLLQALFGWPAPAYAHHPLLLGADGQRLAKRAGAPSLRALRAQGHSPAAVRAMAGFPD